MPASNRRPLFTEEEAAEVAAASAPSGSGIIAAEAGDVVLMAPPDTLVITEQPCTIKGLASAAGAGVLGYLLGVVPAAIRHKARQWALTHKAGTASASQLALMSGLYTTIHCICTRLRQTDDGWNRGLAGCATGLALGWSGGPASALQSCMGLGAISYLIDFGPTTAPAQAAVFGRASQPAPSAQARSCTIAATTSTTSSSSSQQQPGLQLGCSGDMGCLIPQWLATPPRLSWPHPAAAGPVPPPIQWLGHLLQQHTGM